ncbi:MAG: YeeE/YedE family protein, partial [Hyphomicrobiales bacterium]|nr:YeeE/YedE family protein [Hyphomicrobiales bacterium]
RWEACDDARELGRHLLGATLMGVGGVFAMGCTVGQGITGFSTLAISAPIVFLSIAFGAKLGLAWLIEGSMRNGIPWLNRDTGHPAE